MQTSSLSGSSGHRLASATGVVEDTSHVGAGMYRRLGRVRGSAVTGKDERAETGSDASETRRPDDGIDFPPAGRNRGGPSGVPPSPRPLEVPSMTRPVALLLFVLGLLFAGLAAPAAVVR